MKKTGAFFILILGMGAFSGNTLKAQTVIDADTIATDTIAVDTAVIDTTEYADTTDLFQKKHDPRKAWQYSAIIPGLGQAYNKKYWKIPFVYAAGAAAYYYYYESARRYHALHDIYVEYQNFGTVTMNARQQLYDITENDLILEMNSGDMVDQLADEIPFQQKHMERAVVVMFAVYFANILDALVDGYFFTYDVEQELAFDVKPGLWQSPFIASTTPTLSLRITF